MIMKRPNILLLIPLMLAIFAVAGYGFFFKAAVPGSCAIILALLFRKQFKAMPDIWVEFHDTSHLLCSAHKHHLCTHEKKKPKNPVM
jgi:hypothetical protein